MYKVMETRFKSSQDKEKFDNRGKFDNREKFEMDRFSKCKDVRNGKKFKLNVRKREMFQIERIRESEMFEKES